MIVPSKYSVYHRAREREMQAAEEKTQKNVDDPGEEGSQFSVVYAIKEIGIALR